MHGGIPATTIGTRYDQLTRSTNQLSTNEAAEMKKIRAQLVRSGEGLKTLLTKFKKQVKHIASHSLEPKQAL